MTSRRLEYGSQKKQSYNTSSLTTTNPLKEEARIFRSIITQPAHPDQYRRPRTTPYIGQPQRMPLQWSPNHQHEYKITHSVTNEG